MSILHTGVLAIALAAICLHYGTMLETLMNCSVPFFYGDPGTGKTMALCTLGATGGLPQRLLSRVTVPSILSKGGGN